MPAALAALAVRAIPMIARAAGGGRMAAFTAGRMMASHNSQQPQQPQQPQQGGYNY